MPKGWNSILGALPNLESLRGGCKGQSNSKGLQNQVSLYLLSTSYGEVNGIKCSETKRKKKMQRGPVTQGCCHYKQCLGGNK